MINTSHLWETSHTPLNHTNSPLKHNFLTCWLIYHDTEDVWSYSELWPTFSHIFSSIHLHTLHSNLSSRYTHTKTGEFIFRKKSLTPSQWSKGWLVFVAIFLLKCIQDEIWNIFWSSFCLQTLHQYCKVNRSTIKSSFNFNL